MEVLLVTLVSIPDQRILKITYLNVRLGTNIKGGDICQE